MRRCFLLSVIASILSLSCSNKFDRKEDPPELAESATKVGVIEKDRDRELTWIAAKEALIQLSLSGDRVLASCLTQFNKWIPDPALRTGEYMLGHCTLFVDLENRRFNIVIGDSSRVIEYSGEFRQINGGKWTAHLEFRGDGRSKRQ